MLAISVFLRHRCDVLACASPHANPGRGLFAIYGKWGSSRPAPRTPLGAALSVPRRPGDRMGFRGSAWPHARHQRQWHVHRGARPSLGWRRFLRAIKSDSAIAGQLHGETHRTGLRNGRYRLAIRIGKPEAVSGLAFVTHSTGRMIPPYTSAVPCGAGAACGKE